MSQFLCTCGHAIKDTTDRLPCKAHWLPDVEDEIFHEAVANAAQALSSAAVTNSRDEWLAQHGFLEGYPKNLSDREVFSDYVASLELEHFRFAYECLVCGRLWLQRKSCVNEYVCFKPESGKCEHVLGGDVAAQPAVPADRGDGRRSR